MNEDERAQVFHEELSSLMKKHQVENIICNNWDNNDMGYMQMTKIIKTEVGYMYVIAFSGRGEVLCPCCAKKGEGTHNEP